MLHGVELVTARLRLRQWRDADLEPWLALNRDPEVMTYFPALLVPDPRVVADGLERPPRTA